MRTRNGTQSLREDVDRRIADLASRQQGVFSRDQAIAAGATKRVMHTRVSAGRWEQICPGVYRIPGTVPTWRQSLTIVSLGAGPGAAVSHRASAPLWRLPGFEPKLIEISAPRGRDRRCIEGVIVHRVASLERVDITRIDGIPVTTPARTLIDLCSVASREAVEEALDDALRRNLVTVPRLQRRLEQLAQRGRPGIRVMRALLEQRDPRAAVPDSVFERRLLRVLREAGLPPPSVHHRVRVGGRTMVIDFAYVKERIAIEAEGYEWHSGRARFERDLARRNALTALGWQVIHATWQDLTTGRDRFTELIAALLENR